MVRMRALSTITYNWVHSVTDIFFALYTLADYIPDSKFYKVEAILRFEALSFYSFLFLWRGGVRGVYSVFKLKCIFRVILLLHSCSSVVQLLCNRPWRIPQVSSVRPNFCSVLLLAVLIYIFDNCFVPLYRMQFPSIALDTLGILWMYILVATANVHYHR